MTVVKLTEALVRRANASNGKRLEITDKLVSGFGLRVAPTGHRSWFIRYRTQGGQKRRVLGAYPALSVAQARKSARAFLASIDKGGKRQRNRPKAPLTKKNTTAVRPARRPPESVMQLSACISEGRIGARMNGPRGVAIYP